MFEERREVVSVSKLKEQFEQALLSKVYTLREHVKKLAFLAELYQTFLKSTV